MLGEYPLSTRNLKLPQQEGKACKARVNEWIVN